MNANRIYTRKTMGLDNRVWRLMIAMIIISIGLLSYRLSDKKECIPFSFTVKNLSADGKDVYYTGEIISFIASSASKDIMWDFGDKSGSIGATAHHKFLEEGNFRVSAGSNFLCETEKQITIRKRPVIVQPNDDVAGNIIGPASCFAFTEQSFTWTGEAKHYEWTVPNHPSLGTKTGQTVTYTFFLPDIHTVQVELDHDRTKRYTLDVRVQEKKPPPKELITRSGTVGPDPIPAPPILIPPVTLPDTTDLTSTKPNKPNKPKWTNDASFKSYLQNVIDKEWGVQNFETYGIEPSTPVTINNKDHKSFTWLCTEIIKTKKIGIFPFKKSVTPTLEKAVLYYNNNNIVTLIEVNYKYK